MVASYCASSLLDASSYISEMNEALTAEPLINGPFENLS